MEACSDPPQPARPGPVQTPAAGWPAGRPGGQAEPGRGGPARASHDPRSPIDTLLTSALQATVGKRKLKDKLRDELTCASKRAAFSQAIALQKAAAKDTEYSKLEEKALAQKAERAVQALVQVSGIPAEAPAVSLVRIVAANQDTKQIYGNVMQVVEQLGAETKVKPLDPTSPGVRTVKTEWTKPFSKDFKQTSIVNLKSAQRTFKQDALAIGGVSDPPSMVHSPLEKLSEKCNGPEPNWDHIQLGLSQLELSFDKQPYTILPVQTAYAYLQAVSEGTSKDMVERVGEFLSRVLQFRKLLLIPISQDKHFTLLAVSKDEVRYYDGWDKLSKACWEAARLFCERIGVSMPDAKTNVSSQIGAECGICLLHWAEGELRKLSGEDFAIVGWPHEMRMREIRKRVSGWVAALEKERQRWSAEIKLEEEERARLAQEWLKAIEQHQALKQLSEEAAADAKALAKELSKVGESVSPMEVPSDFKQALRRLQQVRKEQADLQEALLQQRERELSLQDNPTQFALDMMDKQAQADETKPDAPKPEGAELEEKPAAPEPEGAEGKASKRRARRHLDKQLKQCAEFVELADWDFRTELLDDNAKRIVYRVLKKPLPWRVCAKCHHKSGCLDCDAYKCMRHHLVKQGHVGPGIWEDSYLQGK